MHGPVGNFCNDAGVATSSACRLGKSNQHIVTHEVPILKKAAKRLKVLAVVKDDMENDLCQAYNEMRISDDAVGILRARIDDLELRITNAAADILRGRIDDLDVALSDAMKRIKDLKVREKHLVRWNKDLLLEAGQTLTMDQWAAARAGRYD